MAIFPVTRVSVGDSLLIGNPSVKNTADAIPLLGITPPVITGGVVTRTKLLDISMVAANPELAATSIRFNFGGATVQPKVTAGNQLAFGWTVVERAALNIKPAGIDDPLAGTPFVISEDSSFVDFDFINNIPITNAQNLPFHYGAIIITNVGLGESLRIGDGIKLTTAFNARPKGIAAGASSTNHLVYNKAHGTGLVDLDLSLPPPYFEGRFNFGGASPITKAGGINQSSISLTSIKHGAPTLQAVSIYDFASGVPLIHNQPTKESELNSGVLDFSMLRGNQPSTALNIGFYFWENRRAANIGFDTSVYGQLTISNKDSYLLASSWSSSNFSIATSVRLTRVALAVSGFTTLEMPKPNVIKTGQDARGVGALGIKPIGFGAAKIYNGRQYIVNESKTHSLYGKAYLKGGVRWLKPAPFLSQLIGLSKLTNTAANRRLIVSGIPLTPMPRPVITPHMIYARGISAGLFGVSKLIPTPVIRARGVQQSLFSDPTVWFHTRPVTTRAIDAYESGYPKVFDPTQFVYSAGINRSAIFGDVYIKNNNSYVSVFGVDTLDVGIWATALNRNRSIAATSVLPAPVGDSAIRNKSPSIFYNGIEPPVFNAPAIGSYIRYINTPGINLLTLGNIRVIKTPELKPAGFDASRISAPTVSNYTRYVKPAGREYSAVGIATAWFRYRYVTAKSFYQPKHGKPDLSHGVREIIVPGFRRDSYGQGNAIEYSTRLIEAQGIDSATYSNHMVGGLRFILAQGYVATLFGTRVIPVSKTVSPQGFTGVFGLLTTYLKTQYVKAQGYLSAGDQPAFRWGDLKAYNSRQYVELQTFDDSELTPPAWSDWTLIENRNKTIGTIGMPQQRFGYSQIDNNAELLTVASIEAPVIGAKKSNMISYRIRKLMTEGIDAPVTSSWGVVYNDARVVGPMGFGAESFGNPNAVKTRRYFNYIGNIESFESGTPMVAFAIRTLDIEKRHSIEPPIIRLPVVDLYTRYVGFRGYETAAYGTPALSIHFNIITTRWSHRDKGGMPTLKNLTPELLTYGRDASEFGVSELRTQWRKVNVVGDNTVLFGLSRIADTKQHILVRGWLDTNIGKIQKIVRTGSNPYSVQNIWLNGEGSNNGGYGIYQSVVPRPSLGQNVIYVDGIKPLRGYGNAYVWSNTLFVDSGIAIHSVSENVKVFNSLQFLDLNNGQPIESRIAVGTPRLSPHTIYAVAEAPSQAQFNHGAKDLHYVGETNEYPAGERFGKPAIWDSLQTIKEAGKKGVSSVFGIPRASLSRHVIYPDEWRSANFGLFSIPFTLKNIKLRGGIKEDKVSSDLRVYRGRYLGPQTIRAGNLVFTGMGRVDLSNYIRTLQAKGNNQLLMGASKQKDYPFMWQGLRIGERVESSIGAGDTSIFGATTRIELYIRELNIKGFNAFSSTYDPTMFDGKMVVRNRKTEVREPRYIMVNAISETSTGLPSAMLGQHFIRPDGNSNQFRKGGYHA